MPETILITGATGTIAGAAVGRLAEQGAAIRVTTRDEDRRRELADAGYDAVRVDFADAEAVGAALNGVTDLLLVTAQHPDQTALHGNVISAAAAAGVGHIVKVSGGGAVTRADSPSFFGRSHANIEEQIMASGLAFTFLRPNYLMQNLLNLAAPVKGGKLPAPLGNARIAMIDGADVGRVAAAVLTEPAPHAGQVYDLTGPVALTMEQVAESMSHLLGHPVQYVSPPIDAAAESLKANGAPEWLVDHFREISAIFATNPSVAEVTDTVERLTGHPAASIDDFLARHASTFGATVAA